MRSFVNKYRKNIARINMAGRPWTTVEARFAILSYDFMNAEEIGKKIGRSPNAVRKYMYYWGYSMRRVVNTKQKPWTAEEAAFVLKHFGLMTARQISERLSGRSPESVRLFVRRYDEARGAR
jgi:hypothetical protein